jgi:hypothetical protein
MLRRRRKRLLLRVSRVVMLESLLRKVVLVMHLWLPWILKR